MADIEVGVQYTGEASGLVRANDQAKASFDQLYTTVRDNWWGVRNIGLAFGAIGGAVAAGTGAVINAAADFEDALQGVERTTFDLTKSTQENINATADLGEELRQLALVKPLPIGTIAQIAEEAGALGIARENIAEFTTVIADLAATTNLSADQATGQLARIANVTNLDPSQYRNLASAILEAGRSTAATETEIVNLARRLSGAAAAAGITADQIIGISAAVLSLGPRAEAGATAVQKTIFDMAAAIAEGGSELKIFAQVAGLSVEEFSQTFREDGATALLMFVEGLGRMKGDAVATTQVLGALGITEARQVAALTQLAAGTTSVAGANVSLRNVLQTTSKAFAAGTAVTEIAARRYQSTKAQLQLLGNAVRDTAITLGTFWLPVVRVAAGLARDFALGLGALPEPVRLVAQALTIAVGALAALAAGFLLLGPRVVLALDAYRKLRGALASGTAASVAERAATEASAVATARKATAETEAASATAAHATAARANTAALAGEAAAAEAAAGANATLAVAASSSTAASAAATAASAAQMQRLGLTVGATADIIPGLTTVTAASAQQMHHLGATVGATADVIPGLSGEIGATGRAATTTATRTGVLSKAFGSLASLGSKLGGALKALFHTPIGRIVVLAAVAIGAVAAITRLGKSKREAAEAATKATVADDELTQAIRRQMNGSRGAVTALLIQRNVHNGLAASAEALGLSLNDVVLAIQGLASASVQANIVNTLNTAMASGNEQAIALATSIQEQSEAYLVASRAAATQERALKQAGIESDAAEQGAIDLGKSVAKAADRIRAMNEALYALGETSMSVREAEMELARAQEELADVQTKAPVDRLKEAELALTQALLDQQKAARDLEEAHANLATARQRQLDALKDAEHDLADAQDAVVDANEKVRDSQEKLDKLRSGPTADELRDATNKLANAELRLLRAQQSAADAQWYLNYLREEGASERDIQDAELGLAEASQEVKDQQDDAIDAQKELNDVRDGASPEELAEAERDLEKAVRDSEKAQRDLIEAEKEVAQLREDIANDTAYKEAQLDLVEAQQRLAETTLAIKQAQKDLADERSGINAAREEEEAQLRLEQALFRLAKARAEARVAAREAAGEQLTESEKAAILADEMDKLAARGGPAAEALRKYADALRRVRDVPKEDTSVDSVVPKGGGAVAPPKMNLDALKVPGEKAAKGLFDSFMDYVKDNVGTLIAGTLISIGVAFLAGVLGAPALLAVGIGALASLLFDLLLPQSWKDGINSFVRKIPGYLKPIPGAIGRFFTETIPRVFGGALDFIKRLPSMIGEFFTNLPSLLSGAAGVAMDAIGNFFSDLPEKLGYALGFVLGTIIDYLFIKPIGALVEYGPRVIGAIVDFFAKLPGRAWSAFTTAFSTAWLFAQFFASWLKTNLPKAISAIVDFAKKLPGRLWSGFKEAYNAVIDLPGFLASKFAAAAKAVGSALKDAGSALVGFVASGVRGAFRAAFDFLGGFFRGLFDALPANVKNSINGVIGIINSFLRKLGNVSIPIPEVEIPGLGKLGGGSIGFPMIQVPYLAKGGLFSSPTLAMVGEAGTEAVTPIRDLLRVFAAVDAIALELAGMEQALQQLVALDPSGGGGDTFNLTVHSGASAREIVDEYVWATQTRRR